MPNQCTLEAVLAPDNIQRAWKRVRRNQGAAGEDSISIAEMEAHWDCVWPGLEQSIREGSYRPAPLRPVSIPKPQGGTRKLAIPSVPDRLVQQACVSVLTPGWEKRFPETSYAYRPERHAHMAIADLLQRAGQQHTPYVLRTDIKNYFDTVAHSHAEQIFSATPCDMPLLSLCMQAITAPLASVTGPRPRTQGLPQGSPLSPLVSNAILLPFDRQMASSPNTTLFRYADDILILVPDAVSAERAGCLAKASLEKMGLDLNQDKTRIGRLKDVTFLGFGFSRNDMENSQQARWRIELPQETMDACRSHLRRMEDSCKSPREMQVFLRQWYSYFLPTENDRMRHQTFLRSLAEEFGLPPANDSHYGSAKNPATTLHLQGSATPAHPTILTNIPPVRGGPHGFYSAASASASLSNAVGFSQFHRVSASPLPDITFTSVSNHDHSSPDSRHPHPTPTPQPAHR